MKLGDKVKIRETGKRGPRRTGEVIGADATKMVVRVKLRGGTEIDAKVEDLEVVAEKTT